MISLKSYLFSGVSICPRPGLAVLLTLGIMLWSPGFFLMAQQQSDSTSAPTALPKLDSSKVTVVVEQEASQAVEPEPASASPKSLTTDRPSPDVAPEKPERLSLDQILADWHSRTLDLYHFNITSLADPFLPIKEVRGSPEDQSEAKEDESLPAIQRLEINQLKLVAITIFSKTAGDALASFEDGAGVSYILRQGDLIGRHKGYIVKIEPSRVIIEEFPKRGLDQDTDSRTVELAMDTLTNITGLTRSPDKVDPDKVDPDD